MTLEFDGERPSGPWTTIVSLSIEQTAEWLRGGTVQWSDGLVDPGMRRKFDEQRLTIVQAVDRARAEGVSLDNLAGRLRMAALLVPVLTKHSPQTAKRVQDLAEQASKDHRADQLLQVVFYELFKLARLPVPTMPYDSEE